jgi:hypothetical protein
MYGGTGTLSFIIIYHVRFLVGFVWLNILLSTIWFVNHYLCCDSKPSSVCSHSFLTCGYRKSNKIEYQFAFCGLTWSRIELTFYCTRGQRANHDITEAVYWFIIKSKTDNCSMIKHVLTVACINICQWLIISFYNLFSEQTNISRLLLNHERVMSWLARWPRVQ